MSGRPNILFVLTDDQGAWAMGCSGNSELKTPNLDSFVAIANALGVSADALLVDVVDHVEESIACELSTQISRLSLRERSKILNAIRILIEE